MCGKMLPCLSNTGLNQGVQEYLIPLTRGVIQVLFNKIRIFDNILRHFYSISQFNNPKQRITLGVPTSMQRFIK